MPPAGAHGGYIDTTQLLLHLALEERAESITGEALALGRGNVLVENGVMRPNVLAVRLMARAGAQLTHRLLDAGHI